LIKRGLAYFRVHLTVVLKTVTALKQLIASSHHDDACSSESAKAQRERFYRTNEKTILAVVQVMRFQL